jgi:putative membrane protein
VSLTPLPVLNEAFMLASAGCLIAGWNRIRHGKVRAHRRYMLLAAALGAGFFLSYAVKTLVEGDATFGGPAAWATPYQVFLQTHVTLATVAAVLGILTLRLAFRRRFRRHRRIAPWTAVMWLVAAGTGLAVFAMLYLVFPTGPAVNVLRAILGG